MSSSSPKDVQVKEKETKKEDEKGILDALYVFRDDIITINITRTETKEESSNSTEESSKEVEGKTDQPPVAVAMAVPVKQGPSPEELYAKRMEETKYALLSYKIFEKFKWFNCAHTLKLHSAMSGVALLPNADGVENVKEKCDESKFRFNKQFEMKRFLQLCRMLGTSFDLRYQLFDLEQDEKGVVKSTRSLAGQHIRGIGLGATPSCDPKSAHGFMSEDKKIEDYDEKKHNDPWLRTYIEIIRL